MFNFFKKPKPEPEIKLSDYRIMQNQVTEKYFVQKLQEMVAKFEEPGLLSLIIKRRWLQM